MSVNLNLLTNEDFNDEKASRSFSDRICFYRQI
jgi:hypothetical protein